MFDLQDKSWLIATAFIGALILWCKELPDNRRVYGLSEVLENLQLPTRTCYFAQMIAFLLMGTYLALILTNPSHVRQALAAGLGWTASLTTTKRKPRSRAQAAGSQ